MKINRFVALAAIALLVVGAMGAIATRSFAQTSHPTAHVQATAAPDDEEDVGADTDDVYSFGWLHYAVLDVRYQF